VRLVRDAKARGIRVTAEVTPHHLLLTDEAVRDYDPNTKMAPPLRASGTWKPSSRRWPTGPSTASRSDHAPHALTEKEGEFAAAANGIVGLRDGGAGPPGPPGARRPPRPADAGGAHVHRSRAPAEPARGQPRRRRRPADITVLDLEQPWTVTPASFRSRSRNTPFRGWTGVGAPVMTIVGGVPALPPASPAQP
jgi:dihydroorotase